MVNTRGSSRGGGGSGHLGARRVHAVLVTVEAIKDILFTKQETANVNTLSATKIKALIVKGLWRYSHLNLGQYVKVEIEPPVPSFGAISQTSNSRPVIIRIVSVEPAT
jgi:hypothetical protein